MKKNVLMRAASGLLVATMLTTCAISGTFAKYVTQDNGDDVARVAKWGVVVQVEGDLYGENYLNGTVNIATDKDDVDASVSSKSNGGNLVAPGTNSADSPYSFGINGTPEVDSKTTIEIDYQNIYLNRGKYGVMVPVADKVVTETNFDELNAGANAYDGLWVKNGDAYERADAFGATTYYTLEDYVDNADIYYPVAYTLEGDTSYDLHDEDGNGPDNKSANTLKLISEAILGKVGATSVSWTDNNGVMTASSTVHVEHNVDLADELELSAETLTWAWEFHDNKTKLGTVGDTTLHEEADHDISQQDKLDTILGNLMAERVNTPGDFNGEVVKLNDGTSVADWAWAAPEEVVTGDAKDFCLDTLFNICILVEQDD